MENPIAVLTPTKSTAKNFFYFALWVVLTFLLVFAIYWIFFKPKVSMKEVKRLIGLVSAKYSDPVNTEKILMQGVQEILISPLAMRQAKTYSGSSKIPIEQVIVDNAVAMSKEFGYIA